MLTAGFHYHDNSDDDSYNNCNNPEFYSNISSCCCFCHNTLCRRIKNIHKHVISRFVGIPVVIDISPKDIDCFRIHDRSNLLSIDITHIANISICICLCKIHKKECSFVIDVVFVILICILFFFSVRCQFRIICMKDDIRLYTGFVVKILQSSFRFCDIIKPSDFINDAIILESYSCIYFFPVICTCRYFTGT